MKLDCFYASGYILKTQGTRTNVRYDVIYDIGIGFCKIVVNLIGLIDRL
jgi:hypothetical protein